MREPTVQHLGLAARRRVGPKQPDGVGAAVSRPVCGGMKLGG